jgi:hypothetical protein
LLKEEKEIMGILEMAEIVFRTGKIYSLSRTVLFGDE